MAVLVMETAQARGLMALMRCHCFDGGRRERSGWTEPALTQGK
jgi:hypothetical protein